MTPFIWKKELSIHDTLKFKYWQMRREMSIMYLNEIVLFNVVIKKLLKKTPCPIIRPEVRDGMTQVAINAAKAVNYVGAGTVEFSVG